MSEPCSGEGPAEPLTRLFDAQTNAWLLQRSHGAVHFRVLSLLAPGSEKEFSGSVISD